MAILQALIAFIGRSAGKILNAAFGWAVRALFGQVSGTENALLTALVAAAALWPLLVAGIFFPRVASFAVAFVPLPKWFPEDGVRIAWLVLAALVPLLLGAALGGKPRQEGPREVRAVRILRGFPATIGISLAFWIALVSVPVMHIATLLRGWRDAHVPLITTADGYDAVAERIQGVLNGRGFELRPARPQAWSRASIAVLKSLGGPSVAHYVPKRLARLVGPKLQVTLHPSSLLLRGPTAATTLAQGLVVEALTPCNAFQTTDPKAQEIEREIRRVWRVFDENPEAHEHSGWLDHRLTDISEDIVKLEVRYDDWQTVYRQALQLGRAIDGKRQLLAKAELEEAESEAWAARQGDVERLQERSTISLVGEVTSKVALLARKEVELARRELEHDVRAELATVKGAGVALLGGIATLNLLLVSGVLALAPHASGWVAALSFAGVTLAVTLAAALLAKRWHVEKPLARTRKTLSEDVEWAEERMA
jgi:hypothetical protein